jgi:hypothetical protein
MSEDEEQPTEAEKVNAIATTERVRNHYLETHGEAPPDLHEGDVVRVAGYPTDLFTVVGSRADGMLVECVRHGDGQEFCCPRYQSPGGWVAHA